MHALDAFATLLFDRLAWSSLQAVVLIALVAAVIRLRPQLPAAARCLLWWLVGLQLLVGLVWHAPVPLRWLAAPAPMSAPVRTTLVVTNVSVQGLPLIDTAPVVAAPLGDRLVETGRSHWQIGLLALWLAGLALLLGKALRQAREARSLRRDSAPADDAALLALCARRARELHLRRCPRLRVCARIESPQVIGLLQPVILLPADHALSADEAAMALDHELVHLRRGDLWAAWIPALAQRLFFFHPLVAWAMREYALHREAACDAQVLRQSGSAPQAYGRLLLRLGVSHPLHAGLAGASPTFENLKRRLTMLQQIESSSRLRGWLLVALIAAVGVVPYRVTTAAASPAPRAETLASPATDPHPQVAPTPAAQPTPPSQVAPHVAPAPRVPPTPPTPPTPPALIAPPPPPPAPPAPMAGVFANHSHVSIDTDDDAHNGFALLDGDSIIMRGTSDDVRIAQRQRKNGEPLLWVRRDDRAYVIRDPILLARAKAAYAPIDAIAKEQGKLGGRQGELGGRQGGLGAQQGELGRQQAELAAQRAALEGQRDADQRRASLDARQQSLEQRQAELGKQQEALGQQQQVLGRQQEMLGRRQQQAYEKANRQMGELIDEAVAKGQAQPVPVR